MQIFRLRCHNFELIRPVGVEVKHIAIGAGGFGCRCRPLAQLLSAQVIGAEGVGLDSRDGQIGTVLPTACHRCDVSVLPKRQETGPSDFHRVVSQHSTSPFTIAEKIKPFLKRTDFSSCGACRNCYHVFIANNTIPLRTF